VELFLKTVWENSPDYYALFLCALHAGMRSAEIAGLQWGDIDWNQRLIIVRRIVNKKGKVTPTKTNRIRTIDMSSALFNELKEHFQDKIGSGAMERHPIHGRSLLVARWRGVNNSSATTAIIRTFIILASLDLSGPFKLAYDINNFLHDARNRIR
jgi:integrase